MFKKSEYDRWMKQSRKTLKSAYNDLENEDYEWASFKAQQSAELAVKAILRGLGMGPIGHSITRLLREFTNFNVEVPREILRCAMELDRNYIAPAILMPTAREHHLSIILKRLQELSFYMRKK